MSKGADIIDVMQRLGGVADRLDYRKAAALGSTFLTLGAAPEVAASAANAMVRELSIATMQSKSFFEGMNLLKLNPEVIEKQMTKDAMGTIQRVLEKVNALPQDKRLSAMTMLFGKEFGDDAAKLANNLPELQRQLKLTAGNDALGSMQKESDINKDSLSAQWLLVKTGAQNTFSSLGETLRQPLMDILYTVKSVTGALRRWVEANPELTGTLMKVAAIVAAVTVGLGTLAVALAAVLGPLAVIRLGFSVLGIKTLPSVTAAVTRTSSALSWLAGAPLAVLRRGLASSGNRRPSTQFLGPDNDMLTLSGVLMPEITGGRLSLLALEQMAEQGKAWPLIEGSGTIYGMYVIEGLNQTKTEFFRDGMPRRIEFTLSLKRVDESLSDMFGDLSAQLNNLQDTATSALNDISKTVGGLLS